MPVAATMVRAVLVESADGVGLEGELVVPADAVGAVVFAHGSGSGRTSPRNNRVARLLNEIQLATLLFDLLTPEEAGDRRNVFDVPLLAGRLASATARLRADPECRGLPVGYFGASTGAAAALWAAADDARVGAIVSRGGRPDLAGERLFEVRTPTLLVVGSFDPVVLDLNEQARLCMRCECTLRIVPGATHLFEEAGALDTVARLAGDWFLDHLVS
jgi:putative phosphoribosyl transferase